MTRQGRRHVYRTEALTVRPPDEATRRPLPHSGHLPGPACRSADAARAPPRRLSGWTRSHRITHLHARQAGREAGCPAMARWRFFMSKRISAHMAAAREHLNGDAPPPSPGRASPQEGGAALSCWGVRRHPTQREGVLMAFQPVPPSPGRLSSCDVKRPLPCFSFHGAVRTADLLSCVSRGLAFEGDKAIMPPASLERGRAHTLSH